MYHQFASARQRSRASWLLATATLAATLVIGGARDAQGATITADYTTVADGSYPSVVLAGTTVTGSANVTSSFYAGFRGLGVGGGPIGSLDFGEALTISFGQLVQNVTLSVVDIAPVGNASLGFEAFSGVASLGFFALPTATLAPQTYDLTALAGGLSFSSFTLTVPVVGAPLGFQIQSVSYDPATVPEPSALLLVGAAVLAAYRRSGRRA